MDRRASRIVPSVAPIQNVPPGIQTMPSGAGPGGFFKGDSGELEGSSVADPG